MGRLTGHMLVSLGVIGALLTAGATTALGSTAPTPAVAYQLNARHNGVTADTVAAQPAKQWSVGFSGAVSYPLIVHGRVYVTVANNSFHGTKLYALDAITGATVWGPVDLGGPYPWSGLSYDGGRVFTVNGGGVMEGFDAATGALEWATQLPGQSLFTSPPTAASGYVYTGGAGSGGTVYAVRETTGVVAWTGPVANGDNSSPAVSVSGVYVSYACGQTYDFRPISGALVWHRTTACEGGGGTTPVLAGNRLYVRDFSFPAVLDANTGALLGPFSAAGPAPAVGFGRVYDLAGGTLTAARVGSGSDTWSFSGDGTLSSAPLVAGESVFIGGTSGELYELSSSTGQVTWSTNVGAGIPAPDEQNVSQPLTGLATSGGLLVVPAGQTLVAYR